MKKLSAIIAACVLLASCSTKMSLVKRKYQKGYHFAVAGKHVAPVHHEARKTTAVKVLKPEEVETVVVAPQPVAPIVKSPVTIPAQSSKATAAQWTAKVAKAVHATNKPSSIESSSEIHKNAVSKAQKKHHADDTNKILLIILCLFPIICLIAVYLHDNKSITMNFWIALLLHILFVIYWLFPLLVVLDVVNLA